MKRLLLPLAICVLMPLMGFGQQSMPSGFEAGQKLYREKKYEEASSQFFNALWELNKQSNKNAAFYADERKILNYIDSSYSAAEKNNIPFSKVVFDTTNTAEFYFFVTKVNAIDADSAIITINAGKQDGIFPGAECTLVGASSSDTSRSLKYLGGARILELSDYTTKFAVKFYKKRKGSPVYATDLLEIKGHVVNRADRNMLYELSRLNISFNDNSKIEFLPKRAIYHNTNPALFDILTGLYASEINDFSSVLDDLDDSSFTIKYKKGRFEGYNLKQVFPSTSAYDITAFFNFVKSYPGKYMGKSWKINETYATWVINFTPTGEKDRNWLIPAIESKDIRSLDNLLKKTSWYIKEDSFGVWSQKIDEYINVEDLGAAKSLCKKLLYIAQKQNDNENIAHYYYRLALLENAEGNKKDALADLLVAYNMFPDNTDYMYYLASMYGQNEKFDSSFYLYNAMLKKYPESYALKGNMGWYKTLAGQFDEAVPLCRDAYFADTTAYNYTVNYGHTFLLKGNTDSAKYYYSKMLQHIKRPKDYTEGPKKDFEIFFSKGWQRKAVAEIAEWLDSEFKERYFYITTAIGLWDEAYKKYEAKDYKAAVAKWKEYVAIQNQLQPPLYAKIRGAYTWIGSCYGDLGQDDSQLVYYDKAMQVTLAHLSTMRSANPDDDYLTTDYKNMQILYRNNKKDLAKSEMYKTLHDAEVQKLTDRYSNARTHIICIGGRDTTGRKNYEADAKYFFNAITAIGSKRDSAPDYIYMTGNELTKQQLTRNMEDIRKKAKPEDIFIFYYAGITATDSATQNDVLCFNPRDTGGGKITIKELLQDIDLIYAKKKIIITADPNPALLTAVTAEYAGSTNISAEIIFLCPAVKPPIASDGNSVFTKELVNALDELKKKEKFSARDFVDKASSRFGRDEHYLPVLSFNFGKDFLLYQNDSIVKEQEIARASESRGLEIDDMSGNGNDLGGNNTGTQKNYALFFASDVYDDNNTWHNLSNPISDANALAKLLSEDFGFEIEVVKNASKKEIETKLKQYRGKNFSPNDQLMIFFAGHGIYYPDANMGYLVAKDSKDPRTNDPNYNTYLSYSDLGNIYLKNIKCRRIFLVLDACYAGSFFEQKSYRGGGDNQSGGINVAQRLSMLKKNASGKTYYKGVSSGGKETVEDGQKDQHSPFAAGLIQMLNNAINNSYITADAIIGDIQNYHPGKTMPSSGTFNYSDPQGLFIFEVNHQEKKQAERSYNLKQ